jgi:hypothetical protein
MYDDNKKTNEIPVVDANSQRPNDRVLVIRGIRRVLHRPTIRVGRVTKTGITVIVTNSDESAAKNTYHLEAQKIFGGEWVTRDTQYFQLYTRHRFQELMEANLEHVRIDSVPDASDLPMPTHMPASDMEKPEVVT